MSSGWELLGLSGHVLSVAERACLQCTMPLLQQQYRGDVKFWGKLFGLEGDYLMCQITGEDLLSNKKTVYSTDGGLNWNLLDATTDEQRQYCNQLRGLFMGSPQYEYKIEEEVPPEPDQEIIEEDKKPEEVESEKGEEEDEEEPLDEEEEEKGEEEEAGRGDYDAQDAEEEGEEVEPPKPKKPKKRFRIIAIKEATRLSDFVEQVDHHCSVVPRGAFLVDEHNRCIQNKTFEGLAHGPAGKLISYFHNRPARQVNHSLLQKEHYNPNVDFLDPVVDDIPTGVWVLKYNPTFGVVVGSNLLYEGFTFWHKPDTPQYGQYYFGDGERNRDLCFML